MYIPQIPSQEQLDSLVAATAMLLGIEPTADLPNRGFLPWMVEQTRTGFPTNLTRSGVDLAAASTGVAGTIMTVSSYTGARRKIRVCRMLSNGTATGLVVDVEGTPTTLVVTLAFMMSDRSIETGDNGWDVLVVLPGIVGH